MIQRRASRMVAIAAAGILTMFCFPSSTWGIEDPYNELGFFAGIGFADEDLVGTEQSLPMGAVIGVRWRHQLQDVLSLSATMSYVPQFNSDLAFDAWSEAELGASLDWYFWRRERVRWYVSPGIGFMRLSPDNGDAVNRPMATLGIGQKIYPGDPGANVWWEFRLDPTIGTSGLNEEPILQAKLLFGASWGIGGPAPDEDADGIPNRNDRCPGTPKGAIVNNVGCPKDTDDDKVLDGLDKCPDTASGWPVDVDGCPLDTDGDTVPDGGDACPDTQKGAKVDEKGCPTDADGDRVFDGIDTCPETPAGAKVDEKGCPIDSDGDGVFDGIDRCPDTPKGKQVDPTGCPLPEKAAPLFTPERHSLVLEGVHFENDSATLTAGSTEVLNQVAASLRDWPEVRVEVGGHTDSRGSNAYNEKLSERRAAAVQDYLVAQGVPAAQVTVKGYGESVPVADNDTDAGRATNRRVELKKAP